MEGQPDALEPDDEHELQAASGDGHDEGGHAAGGKGPDAEQAELNERVGHLGLDDDEGHQEEDAAGEQADHERVGPAHGVAAVGLDAVGDGDQDGRQADGEGDVPPPVDPTATLPACLTESGVGPPGPEEPDRDVDPEHGSPVQRGEQATGDQADELAGQRGHLVGAEREAPFGRGEGVGQDGRRVGLQHRATDGLEDPPADQPHSGPTAVEGIEREQHRRQGEHGEPGVVDANPPVHVAQPADGHHQHGLDQAVAHDHPQQVADVPRRQRVEMDAPEDRRQGDDDDRAIERGHEHGRRRVGQRHPLVAVIGALGSAGRRVRSTPSGLLWARCRRLLDRRHEPESHGLRVTTGVRCPTFGRAPPSETLSQPFDQGCCRPQGLDLGLGEPTSERLCQLLGPGAPLVP